MDTSPENLPQHIAIIMDGNGRWAQAKGKPRIMGHRQGTLATREAVRICTELNINYLTLYVFSSENWSRPPKEVTFLMTLLGDMIDREVKDMMTKNVRLKVLGEMDRLPTRARKKLQAGIDKTSQNTGLQLNLAISYGGRQEITRACQHLAQKVKENLLDPSDITEDLISQHLYLPEVPDPELMIRTGGDSRISNYLIWQAAYSELYITPELWPDFNEDEFAKAIRYYQSKQRRFGGVIDTDE